MRVDLRDPKCLLKVRRKWQHAMQATDAANSRSAKAMGDMPCMQARQWQMCFPESIGPTTKNYEVPYAGPANAREARYAAMGDPLFVAERHRHEIVRPVALVFSREDYPTLASMGIIHEPVRARMPLTMDDDAMDNAAY